MNATLQALTGCQSFVSLFKALSSTTKSNTNKKYLPYMATLEKFINQLNEIDLSKSNLGKNLIVEEALDIDYLYETSTSKCDACLMCMPFIIYLFRNILS